jgi:precorrin-6B methylase 1
MKTKEKRISDLVYVLERLMYDAERVAKKYGEENSDYTEWKDLQVSIMKAKHIIARET